VVLSVAVPTEMALVRNAIYERVVKHPNRKFGPTIALGLQVRNGRHYTRNKR